MRHLQIALTIVAAVLLSGSAIATANAKSPTVKDVRKVISAAGGSKLYKKACGNTKSKSVALAEIELRRYKLSIGIDRGGQLHFIDATGKKPRRTLLGDRDLRKHKVTAKEVRSAVAELKRDPTCLMMKRQDLDI